MHSPFLFFINGLSDRNPERGNVRKIDGARSERAPSKSLPVAERRRTFTLCAGASCVGHFVFLTLPV